MKLYAEEPKGIDRLDGFAPLPTTTFGGRMAAILRTESDIAMEADKINYYTDNGEPEENYNPYTSGLIPQDMLERHPEEFEGDHNANQTMLTVGRMEHLQQNREIREEAGVFESLLGYGIGGLASSTTIPFMLMPAGALFKSGMAAKGAMNIGKTAAEVAALGAVEESLAEYFRHDLDPYRTRGESYAAVASVALFGGALGALGGKMTNASYARAAKDIQDMKDVSKAASEEGGFKRWLESDGDLSAAKVKEINDAPDNPGWIASKWLGGNLFPGVRLFTSPAKAVRRTADKLINNVFGSKRSASENNIRRTELVARSRARIIGNNSYKNALADGYEGKIDEFYDEIGEALIYNQKSNNKYVSEAAQQYREEILDPILKKYQELGDLPEELEAKFADSYFPRLYRDEVFKQSDEYTQRLKNLILEKDSAKAGDMSDAEALDLAHEYMKKIKGWDKSKLPMEVVGSTGRLKERGINLRDSDLQNIGFLDKNALRVIDKYINSVVPEMEIKVAFGGVERANRLRQLSDDFAENEVRLKKEFEERMKDPKVRQDMTKEEIRIDYEDYQYFAKQKFKAEQEAINEIYKGRMEDAEIEIERIRTETSDRFKPQKAELQNKHETAQTVRRTERDKLLAKEQDEFDDVEKILRKDFENSKPKNELERVKGQKRLEQKIRAARKVKETNQTKIKNASKRKGKKIGKTYAEAKQRIDDTIAEELEPHNKAYEDAKNEAGIKERAAKRETRTAYDNEQDSIRKIRDKELKSAQKEKTGSEQALRREKRSSLRQQKRAIKKLRKEEGGGTHLLSKEIGEINDEYDDLIKAATSQKEIDRLTRRHAADINDIEAMRNKLLGIYKRPADDAKKFSNIGQWLRTWSYLAYMGMVTFASLPDMARALTKHGIGATWKGFRGGFPAFVKGLDSQSAIQREALQDMGISVEALLSSRALMMSDLGDLTGKHATVAKVFTKLTLMNRWNDSMKHIAAISAQHRFLKQIEVYDSLSAVRKKQLEEYGFDKDMIDRIKSEADSFTEVKGARMANTSDWVDQEAAEHFEKMLLRDVEMSIVTPGVGDAPLFMSTESMKLLFQFKSFFFASHVRAFLPMLRQMSQGDANAFMGAMIQLALGGFVVEPVRMLASGRGDELQEKDWQDWAYASMDRSGIATLPLEAFNLTDKFAQGMIGEMIGIKNSRYHQRGIQLSGGPGLGLAENMLKMPFDTIKNGYSEKEVSKTRQMMAGQNLLYAAWIYNLAEDAANDALGN